MNFLSSFKSFLDHWNQKLAHIHEERDLDFVTEYKRITSSHYDRFFSYRFLSRLRNYVQHYALPIQGFRVHFYEEDDQKKLFIGMYPFRVGRPASL